MDNSRVVIAGCGFLGEAAAVFFCEGGWEVLGLCVTAGSAARLACHPFEVRTTDITGSLAGISDDWIGAAVLIHCASSSHGGADAYQAIYHDGLANLIETLQPKRVIFSGSTSVYGQTDGSWVDENSPARPGSETGGILLEAERIALQAGGSVARLSGLYGPGRSVLLHKFLDGSATLENGGARWINQIHRDDAARALVKLADQAVAPGIYNVCDSTPATQRDVYSWISAALRKPLPPEGPPSLSRKRAWTNKRVSNAKLRATGWKPDFPAYANAIPGLLDRPGGRLLTGGEW